jgi:deoxyribose-phosphate aldolase
MPATCARDCEPYIDRVTTDAGRNPGMPLDLARIHATRASERGIGRAAAMLASYRCPKSALATSLLRVVALTDLTSLAGDDTVARIRTLCATARAPLAPRLASALDAEQVHLAAVCVHHAFVTAAVHALSGSNIPVAAVAAGFPSGLTPLRTRVAEIVASVESGAREIDAVIVRAYVLDGEWQRLYDEIRAFREACGDASLKIILATGELRTPTNVARASLVAMQAGADFIKTSTGMEAVNATIPSALIMARCIRSYHAETGYSVGLKPSGGIRTARVALSYLRLAEQQLGAGWLDPRLFRFGASSLLTDVERELQRLVGGTRRTTAQRRR